MKKAVMFILIFSVLMIAMTLFTSFVKAQGDMGPQDCSSSGVIIEISGFADQYWQLACTALCQHEPIACECVANGIKVTNIVSDIGLSEIGGNKLANLVKYVANPLVTPCKSGAILIKEPLHLEDNGVVSKGVMYVYNTRAPIGRMTNSQLLPQDAQVIGGSGLVIVDFDIGTINVRMGSDPKKPATYARIVEKVCPTAAVDSLIIEPQDTTTIAFKNERSYLNNIKGFGFVSSQPASYAYASSSEILAISSGKPFYVYYEKCSGTNKFLIKPEPVIGEDSQQFAMVFRDINVKIEKIIPVINKKVTVDALSTSKKELCGAGSFGVNNDKVQDKCVDITNGDVLTLLQTDNTEKERYYYKLIELWRDMRSNTYYNMDLIGKGNGYYIFAEGFKVTPEGLSSNNVNIKSVEGKTKAEIKEAISA